MNASLWQLAGWTMIHSLWLGAAVALAGGFLRLACRRATPNTRYAISLATLTLLAATPLAAAAWLSVNGVPQLAATSPSPRYSGERLGEGQNDQGTWPSRNAGATNENPFLAPPLPGTDLSDLQSSTSQIIDLAHTNPSPRYSGERLGEGLNLPTTTPQPIATVENPSPSPSLPGRGTHLPTYSLTHLLTTALPHLPTLWLIGAPLTFTLLATGLVGSERLRRRATPLTAGPAFNACQRLRQTLTITRRVALAVCDDVAQPILVGIVRPLILLPTAALAGWTPEQLDMVLLHELAHVRRWDNLVNLLQRIVESILFFHPAVWLVSRQVRRDREECCDAAVIRHTDRPEAYATLLIDIASRLRLSGSLSPTQSLTVASAMASHPLAGRIRRILNIEAEPMRITRRTLAATLLLPLLLASAMFYGAAGAQDPSPSQGGARGGIPDATESTSLNSAKDPGEASARAKLIDDKLEEDATPVRIVYPIPPGTLVDPIELAKAIQGRHPVEIAWAEHQQGIIVSAPRDVHERVVALLKKSAAKTAKFTDDTFRPIMAHNLVDGDNAPLVGGYGILEEFPAGADQSKIDAAIERLKAEKRSFSVEQSDNGSKRIVDQTPPAPESAATKPAIVRNEYPQYKHLRELFTATDANPVIAMKYRVPPGVQKSLEDMFNGLEKDPYGPQISFHRVWSDDQRTVEVTAPTEAHLQYLDLIFGVLSLEGHVRQRESARNSESPANATPVEISQLQNEIRNLESLIVKTQKELVDLEVFRERSVLDSQNTMALIDEAVRQELETDQKLKVLNDRLLNIERFVAAEELNSTNESADKDGETIKNLEALRETTKAKRDAYLAEATKAARERIAESPNEALRAAVTEYKIRRKSAEANLAKYKQELEAARTKMLQLGTNAPADAPSSPNQNAIAVGSNASSANVQGEALALQKEIRNLEDLIITAKKELVDYDVYKDLIGHSEHPGSSEIETAIAEDLDRDPTINTYKSQLFELNATLQTKLTESKNPNTPELKRLRAVIEQVEAEMAKYQAEASGSLRDKYSHIPKNAKLAAERDYYARRKAIEAKLAELQQKLADAKAQFSALPRTEAESPYAYYRHASVKPPLADRNKAAHMFPGFWMPQRPVPVTTTPPNKAGESWYFHYDGNTVRDDLEFNVEFLEAQAFAVEIVEENGRVALKATPDVQLRNAIQADGLRVYFKPGTPYEQIEELVSGIKQLSAPETEFSTTLNPDGSTFVFVKHNPNAAIKSVADPSMAPASSPQLAEIDASPKIAAAEAVKRRKAAEEQISNASTDAAPASPSKPSAHSDSNAPQPDLRTVLAETKSRLQRQLADLKVRAAEAKGTAAERTAASALEAKILEWEVMNEAREALSNQGAAATRSNANDAPPLLGTNPDAGLQEIVVGFPPGFPDSDQERERIRKGLEAEGFKATLSAPLDESGSLLGPYVLRVAVPRNWNAKPVWEERMGPDGTPQKMLRLIDENGPPRPSDPVYGSAAPVQEPEPPTPFPTLENQKIADRAYKLLGLELEPLTPEELERVKKLGYAGGLRVVSTDEHHRPFQSYPGDLLVGVHVWPITDLQSLDELLRRDDLDDLNPLKYFIARNREGGLGGGADGYRTVADKIITGRMYLQQDALASLKGGQSSDLAAVPVAGDFTPISVMQAPTSQKTSIFGGTVTTAYLKVKFDRLPDTFDNASPRLTPQEIELSAKNCLAVIKSPNVLKAALASVATRETVDMKPEEAAEWLRNRLSATFPGDGEIMELKLEGGDAKEDSALLQAVIDAFLAAMKAPPESPADPNSTTDAATVPPGDLSSYMTRNVNIASTTSDYEHPDAFLQALARSHESSKPIVVHLLARNSEQSQRFTDVILADQQIVDFIDKNFESVTIYADEEPAFAKAFHINRAPADMFVFVGGERMAGGVTPPATPAHYLAHLKTHHKLATTPAIQYGNTPLVPEAPIAPLADRPGGENRTVESENAPLRMEGLKLLKDFPADVNPDELKAFEEKHRKEGYEVLIQRDPETGAFRVAVGTKIKVVPYHVEQPTFLYDGKTFDQWRDLWKLELNPERRTEAINALAAFGRTGRGQLAADAILDVAGEYDRSYSSNSPEGALLEAIDRAVARMPANQWMPQVQERILAAEGPEQELWVRHALEFLGDSRDSSEEARQLTAKFADILSDDLLTATALKLYRLDQNFSQPQTVAIMRRALQQESPGFDVTVLGFRHLDKVPEQLDVLLRYSHARSRLEEHALRDKSLPARLYPPLLEVLKNPDRAADHVGALRALRAIADVIRSREATEGRMNISKELTEMLRTAPDELLPATLVTAARLWGYPDSQSTLQSLQEQGQLTPERLQHLRDLDEQALFEETNAE